MKRAETLSKSSAAAAGYSLINGDLLGMDHIVYKGKNTNHDIEYMMITDQNRKILAHSDVRRRGAFQEEREGSIIKRNDDGTMVKEIITLTGNIFEVQAPIVFKGRLLGSIFVGVNQSVLIEAQKKAQEKIFWSFFPTFLLAVIGMFGLSTFITKPIQKLASGVADLKEGKRVKPLQVYSADELGKLTESFNLMSQTITEQQEELQQYTEELENAYVSIVQALAVAIEARDPYTLGHSARVATYSLMIGEKIGLSKKELGELEVAALFHDVGKLRISDSILRKKQPLSPSELNAIKNHPLDGAAILQKVKPLQKYVDSVRHHHEHFDGGGYPDGLNGERIPLHSAIIAIADTYDAMTSTRPYRKAMSTSEALLELRKGRGKQFDPILLEAFFMAMEEKEDHLAPPIESSLEKVRQ